MTTPGLDAADRFIWTNARSLERAIYAYRFKDGAPNRVLEILKTYQNADGGFGQALEPDVRAPDSQPLFVEFALRTLYDCQLGDADMLLKACDYLAAHADLTLGIPTIFPSALAYPHAPHWDFPGAVEPSFDRLIGLVGLANWHGVHHAWLEEAVAVCMAQIESIHFTDAHTIQHAFCLLESLGEASAASHLFDKLAGELMAAEYFTLEAPVTTYSLTPLHFAPAPDAYCRRIFTGAQLDAHLDELQARQQPDGGWPIAWQPPGDLARCEWRAHVTLNALTTLRAYGRL